MKYTIVDKEDISYAGTPRMVYRVVIEVEKIPANEQLEKIALQIWKNGNKDWKEFRIQEFALYGTKWES